MLRSNGTKLIPKILADAALDAGRKVQFVERFSQAADHPVDSAYPEGFILKDLPATYDKLAQINLLPTLSNGEMN